MGSVKLNDSDNQGDYVASIAASVEEEEADAEEQTRQKLRSFNAPEAIMKDIPIEDEEVRVVYLIFGF